jgi:hypothetical protein
MSTASVVVSIRIAGFPNVPRESFGLFAIIGNLAGPSHMITQKLCRGQREVRIIYAFEQTQAI